jgi:hypothetical protein
MAAGLLDSNCACLANMYLNLTRLQAMKSFSFPFAMQPLRASLRTLAEMAICPECGTRNLFQVASVLQAVIERFQRLINAIDDEAAQLAANDESKLFRLGELSDEAMNYHGKDADCAAGFQMRLNAEEWRTMAKKVVRELVEGHGGNDVQGTQSVMAVIDALELRQRSHHASPELMRLAAEQAGFRGCTRDALSKTPQDGKHFCLTIIGGMRTHARMLEWDLPDGPG